jgi:xanthine/uracil permease
MTKNVMRGLAAVGALSTIGAANAAPIDVSSVVSGIGEYTGATSPIVLIGGAVLLVVLAVKAIGWVKSSMK